MAERMNWYRLRKEMYEQLRAEIEDRVGPEPSDIAAARSVLHQELARPWKVCGFEKLRDAWGRARCVLMGDFHALQQSQRGHLRILRAFSEPCRLALECVRAEDQKTLDRFLEGRLSEEAFLKKVKWDQVWGFPWENYQPLFLWARETKTPILALNTAQKSLRQREVSAAKLIAKALDDGRKMIVIYGELHLNKEGLPQMLMKHHLKSKDVLRIFQNIEEAYLRMLKKGLDQGSDLITWDATTFAVQNVPPWVKWQNYLLWFEQKLDEEVGGDGIDITDVVARMVKWQTQELGLNVSPANLTVLTAGEEGLWAKIEAQSSAWILPWFEIMIRDGRSFYFSTGHWGYLSRLSVNHAASLAMQYIHDQLCGGAKIEFSFPKDFERMIWVEAVAYFGSKLVNPKRKSETLVDLRTSLSSHQAGDLGREALRLVLAQKMREMMEGDGRTVKTSLPGIRRRSSWVAAGHLLGAIMGEKMYHGYHRKILSQDLIVQLLKKPLRHESFGLMYREILEMMEAVPTPLKKDKL